MNAPARRCNKCGSAGPLVRVGTIRQLRAASPFRPLCIACQNEDYKARYAKRKDTWLPAKNAKAKAKWWEDPVGSRAKRTEFNRGLAAAARKYLGSKCARCSEADQLVLHIDHIFGGGESERRAGAGGLALYRSILRGERDGELQLLCANCNRIKFKEDSALKFKPGAAATMRRSRKKLRDAIVALMGGCCRVCGLTDDRVLEIDHVHGDGAKHRSLRHRKGIRYILKIVLEEMERYQLLCANCNWRKRMSSAHERGSRRAR